MKKNEYIDIKEYQRKRLKKLRRDETLFVLLVTVVPVAIFVLIMMATS